MMTLEQAQELAPGDFVKVLVEGSDDNGSYEAGAIGIVEHSFAVEGDQKWLVHVSVEGYIGNVFDAADNTGELYDLEKVDPVPIYEVKLSAITDIITYERVIGATSPEQAAEMVLKRDPRTFQWELPDHELQELPDSIEAVEVRDEDGETLFEPPQTSTWELVNARKLREALQAVLPLAKDMVSDSGDPEEIGAVYAAERLLAELTSE